MQLRISTYQNEKGEKVVKTVHGNNTFTFNTFFSYHTDVEDKMISEHEAVQLVNDEQMVLIDTITIEISVTI